MATTTADDDPVHTVARYWWLELVAGIAWIVIALSVLQFDESSVTTVGVLIGIMFVLSGLQALLLAGLTGGALRVINAIFGVLLVIAGFVAMFNPEDTFHGLADILGFLFLLVGAAWIVQGFLQRPVNPVWWLGVVSGVLMLILAFWTSGQFYLQKAYVLLVFAGIWALMHGINDIIRAFVIRSIKDA